MRRAIELSRRVLRIVAAICLIANYSLAVISLLASSLRLSCPYFPLLDCSFLRKRVCFNQLLITQPDALAPANSICRNARAGKRLSRLLCFPSFFPVSSAEERRASRKFVVVKSIVKKKRINKRKDTFARLERENIAIACRDCDPSVVFLSQLRFASRNDIRKGKSILCNLWKNILLNYIYAH